MINTLNEKEFIAAKKNKETELRIDFNICTDEGLEEDFAFLYRNKPIF